MKVKSSALRGRLSLEILRVLAFDVAAPIAVAELFELLRISVHASISLSRFLRAINGPKTFLYVYLHRFAERGLVKVEGRRRQKKVLLTSKGRHLLMKLQKSEERVACEPPIVEEEELRKRIEPLPEEVTRQDALQEKRKKWHKKSRSATGAVFLSYDIPRKWNHRRKWLRETLKNLGFERFHHSFYVGTPEVLRRAIEEAETWGLVPYLCWGNLQVMPG